MMDTKGRGGRTPSGRKGNGAQQLLMAKRKVDNLLPHLMAFPELQQQAGALREALLDEFIREEKKPNGTTATLDQDI